jgi:hypothetical protein
MRTLPLLLQLSSKLRTNSRKLKLSENSNLSNSIQSLSKQESSFLKLKRKREALKKRTSGKHPNASISLRPPRLSAVSAWRPSSRNPREQLKITSLKLTKFFRNSSQKWQPKLKVSFQNMIMDSKSQRKNMRKLLKRQRLMSLRSRKLLSSSKPKKLMILKPNVWRSRRNAWRPKKKDSKCLVRWWRPQPNLAPIIRLLSKEVNLKTSKLTKPRLKIEYAKDDHKSSFFW